MGKFGKAKVISDDIFAYNLGIIGEAGIGKSTLLKEVCEKVVGVDGYIALNIGKEDGHDAINGIVSEDVPNWKAFSTIVDDIVQNKEEEYPKLRVVILDTYDQLFEIVEPEVIRLNNVEAAGKKDGKKIFTINAAFGGFGAGQDKAIELVLDKLWELKSVGVSFAIIGHTKKRDVEDPTTGETYSTLTTNMMQKYFNAIKTKLHVLGVASIDREIVKEKTGKKNMVTHEDIVKGKVMSESRKITFRDDNYTIDSKSRFANIVDAIPLDADAFIKAITDAISEEKNNHKSAGAPHKPTVKRQTLPLPKPQEDAMDDLDVDTDNVEVDTEALLDTIRSKFKTAEREVKLKVKEMLNGGTLGDDTPAETLHLIMELLNK